MDLLTVRISMWCIQTLQSRLMQHGVMSVYVLLTMHISEDYQDMPVAAVYRILLLSLIGLHQ